MHCVFRVISKAVIIMFVTIIVVNTIVLCAATHEYIFSSRSDKWLIQTQRVNAADEGVPVIMLHGFVGSPFDFKPLASEMAKNGFKVTIPLLPRQTRNYFSYNRGAWTPEEMFSLVREIMEKEYNATGKKPILVGFSMGGTIASALCVPSRCQRLVLISPFFSLSCCRGAGRRDCNSTRMGITRCAEVEERPDQ